MSYYTGDSLVRHLGRDQKLLYITLSSLYSEYESYVATRLIEEFGDSVWSPKKEFVKEFKDFFIKFCKSNSYQDDLGRLREVLEKEEIKKFHNFVRKNLHEVMPYQPSVDHLKMWKDVGVLNKGNEYITSYFSTVSEKTFFQFDEIFKELITPKNCLELINKLYLDKGKLEYVIDNFKVDHVYENVLKRVFTDDTNYSLSENVKRDEYLFGRFIQDCDIKEKHNLLIFSITNSRFDLFAEMLKREEFVQLLSCPISYGVPQEEKKYFLDVVAEDSYLGGFSYFFKIPEIEDKLLSITPMDLTLFKHTTNFYELGKSLGGEVGSAKKMFDFVSEIKLGASHAFNSVNMFFSEKLLSSSKSILEKEIWEQKIPSGGLSEEVKKFKI